MPEDKLIEAMAQAIERNPMNPTLAALAALAAIERAGYAIVSMHQLSEIIAGACDRLAATTKDTDNA